MPIQLLPPQLANQIAAGEVVERPASVVKELVENSLDAGATRIEIDIELGGTKRIRIRDNGSGIHKDELVLALARHATSKIASLEDFERITSMGFRGEALANVTSVSRLLLTSRTATQSEAWQVYTEGYDQSIALRPTAHPVGTTVDVLDLFYNMPARRKFMRTEKTEFTHIDEVVRRIALARFDVTFILKHNGKFVRQYRAVGQKSQHLRRLGSLCGQAFVDCALAVSWQQGDLAIRGWVADPAGIDLAEMQYSYVNLRMIRDKLINHAIRQAYQGQRTGEQQQPAFVLFLDVNAHQIDINVHPTKNEVRFHQARLVHDFIYQAILTVLQHSASFHIPIGEDNMRGQDTAKTCQTSGINDVSLPVDGRDSRYSVYQPTDVSEVVDLSQMHASTSGNEGGVDEKARARGRNSQRKKKREPSQQFLEKPTGIPLAQLDIFARSPLTDTRPNLLGGLHKVGGEDCLVSEQTAGTTHDVSLTCSGTAPMTVGNQHSFGQVLTLVSPCYALLKSGENLALLSLLVAERCLIERKLTPDRDPIRPQPLLIPVHMTLREEEVAALKRYKPLLQNMGMTLQGHRQKGTVNAVPLPLRKEKLQKLIPDLLGYLHGKTSVTHNEVAAWLARRLQRNTVVCSHSQAIKLLAEVERLCPKWVKTPPDELLVILNLEAAIKALNHD